MGVPNNGWFEVEYPSKMDDDWGFPKMSKPQDDLFRIFWELHMSARLDGLISLIRLSFRSDVRQGFHQLKGYTPKEGAMVSGCGMVGIGDDGGPDGYEEIPVENMGNQDDCSS